MSLEFEIRLVALGISLGVCIIALVGAVLGVWLDD